MRRLSLYRLRLGLKRQYTRRIVFSGVLEHRYEHFQGTAIASRTRVRDDGTWLAKHVGIREYQMFCGMTSWDRKLVII
jgi:hypothetical protein